MRYINLNKIALEFSKVKNSITIIFNHASIKIPESNHHWNTFYQSDVVALDFIKNTEIFEASEMTKDGFAVLINLNLGK